jgi:leucyl aminopeptidase
VAGNAFHPMDVLDTRKGITVEVGNTDAEGRLILCDALFEAQSEKPEVIFDFATLTGAARVAVGTELPAMFCNDEELASALLTASADAAEPIWRLPLHEDYRRYLDSRVADINNISKQPYGGAITAALFLREFVGKKTPWVHFDIMGFNLESRPGRPYGGEAMGIRAVYQLLKSRYSSAA